MKKNNKELIWSYINGLDVPNIEELEDNYDFMTEVIKRTKDINMINMCSDRLKNNQEFVIFILKTFKNNKELLNKIEKEYINKLNEKDPRYIEMIFLLASLEEKYNENSIYLKYLLKRHYIYIRTRVEYEQYNQITKDKYGLGFMIIKMEVLNKYKNSKIILDYYVKKLLEEIFEENKDYNFEEIIHIRYKEPSTITKNGIRNFIINYICVYDKYLADYVSTYIDLIKPIEKKLEEIIKNYQEYDYKILETKNAIFEEQAQELISNNSSYLLLEEICVYLYKKYIIKIPYLDETLYNLDSLDITNNYNLSFNDMKTIREICKLAKEIYNKNTTRTKLNIIDRSKYIEKAYETKILKLRPINSIEN